MKRLIYFFPRILIIPVFVFLTTACFKETYLGIKADFVVKYEEENKAVPVKITLSNTSDGAESYAWTFEGADITTSTERNPPVLTFTKAGTYKVMLEVKNLDAQVDKKEMQITVGAAIKPAFEVVYDVNNFAPAKVTFKNKSQGATRYEWSFEKADKATATDESPAVTFAQEGSFKVSLKAYNGNSYVTLDSTINIAPALAPNFEYSPLDYNFYYEVPLQLRIVNTSKGSTSQQWAVADPSATIKSVSDSVTIITFSEAKKYSISITASNGKQKSVFQKEITVNPSTNLLLLQDIKLGINDNTNTPNYFVSRRNQAIAKQSLDTLSFGSEVDIAFFARDTDFSYCRFISPDKVATLLMKSIPNAKRTLFVNLIEGCEGCTKVTDAQFTAIKSAKDITAMSFQFGDGVVEGFDDSVMPRYVPFKTYDNRIGIIKIKSVNPAGYIVADIKVMRKP